MFSTLCRIEQSLCNFKDLDKIKYLKKLKLGLLAFYFASLTYIVLDVTGVF